MTGGQISPPLAMKLFSSRGFEIFVEYCEKIPKNGRKNCEQTTSDAKPFLLLFEGKPWTNIYQKKFGNFSKPARGVCVCVCVWVCVCDGHRSSGTYGNRICLSDLRWAQSQRGGPDSIFQTQKHTSSSLTRLLAQAINSTNSNKGLLCSAF